MTPTNIINGRSPETIIKFFNLFDHVTKMKLGNELNKMDITNIKINKSNEVCKFINTSRAIISETEGIYNIRLINKKQEEYLNFFKLYDVLQAIRSVKLTDIESTLKNMEEVAFTTIDTLKSYKMGICVNVYIDLVYINLLEFYTNKPELELFFKVMKDFHNVIEIKLSNNCDIIEDLNFIKELVYSEKINIYYIRRHMVVLRDRLIEDDYYSSYVKTIDEIIKHIEKRISKREYAMIQFNISGFRLHSSMIETFKEINMRNKFLMKGALIKEINHQKLTLGEYSLYENNPELYFIFSTMKYKVSKENIKQIDSSLSLELDEVAMLQLKKLNFFYVPFGNSDMKRMMVAVSKDYKQMYLVTRDNTNNDLVFITLYDNMSKDIEYFLTGHTNTYSKKVVLRRFKARVTSDFNNLKILTEGINIDKDGNVHIKYRPKKSYMDSYMEIHKILQENRRQKNVEGMKQNLVHIYLLLQSVEEDLHKKFSLTKKDELIKARTFLMNDFKTYLKEIQKYEPKFDLYEYVLNSEHSSVNLYFNTDTVSGLKKLITSVFK